MNVQVCLFLADTCMNVNEDIDRAFSLLYMLTVNNANSIYNMHLFNYIINAIKTWLLRSLLLYLSDGRRVILLLLMLLPLFFACYAVGLASIICNWGNFEGLIAKVSVKFTNICNKNFFYIYSYKKLMLFNQHFASV